MTNKRRTSSSKGLSNLTRVTLSELREYVTDNATIPVSRRWLETIGFDIKETENNVLTTSREEDKIHFNVTH
jgi:hypothetical protein